MIFGRMVNNLSGSKMFILRIFLFFVKNYKQRITNNINNFVNKLVHNSTNIGGLYTPPQGGNNSTKYGWWDETANIFLGGYFHKLQLCRRVETSNYTLCIVENSTIYTFVDEKFHQFYLCHSVQNSTYYTFAIGYKTSPILVFEIKHAKVEIKASI